MSKAWKDSARRRSQCTVLDVIVNADKTYDITFNEKLVGSNISDNWLDAELCAKLGFCGEELAWIKRQLEEHGRAIMIL